MRSLLLMFALAFLLLATLNSSGAGQQGLGPPVTSTEHTPLTSLPKLVLDAELRAADGASFKLSDYSGQVLVVSLWATWCGPCRFETPALVNLYKELRSEEVQIVELSTEDPEASTENVREWIRAFDVEYRVGWATPEISLTLMQGRDASRRSS